MIVNPAIVRRRVAQGVAMVVFLALLPEVAQRWTPSIARYIPPFLLSTLVLTSILYALAVWRTSWFFSLLLPGHELVTSKPLTSEKRRGEVLSAFVSVVVALTLSAMWVASLL
jgi:hypothetical protein